MGEGGGAKKRKEKGGERGWGRGEGTHQFVVFTWHPCFFPATNRKRFLLHYCYYRSPLQYEPAQASVDRRLGSEVCVSARNIKRQNRGRERKGRVRVRARIAGYYR